MKKYSILIFLCLIIFIMTLVKIFYKPTEIVETKVIPTTVLTPTINQYPLQDKLPYQGDKFIINKYTEAMVLQVTTKRTDKTKIKEEIRKWLEDNNVSAKDIQVDWK